MSLPLHKRYEIVFLREHPHGPKLGFDAIAKIVNCSKSTAIHWAYKWKETRMDKNQALQAKEDEKIVALATKDENATSSKIQQKMEEKGVEISARTIRRRLQEAKGKYSRPILKPLLTEKHRHQRLNWAKKHKNFDWNKVIFTDESTFYLNQPIGKTWNFPGHPDSETSC